VVVRLDDGVREVALVEARPGAPIDDSRLQLPGGVSAHAPAGRFVQQLVELRGGRLAAVDTAVHVDRLGEFELHERRKEGVAAGNEVVC